MYSGIAIYNVENISSKEACALGERIFKNSKLDITSSAYYKILESGDHLGDHDIVEMSFPELKEKIESNLVTAFRIFCEKKGVQPWVASFGYVTKDIGGFFYIDAQLPIAYLNSTCLIECFNSLGELSFSYGIGYFSDKVSKSFYYATGDNMVKLYPYENSSLFKKESPGRFKGRERYNDTMLRMVYPVNAINECHLGIDINGVSLREWILSSEKHGELEKLNNGMWLWNVPENNLDEINTFLGEAGILISWTPPLMKKASRKLP